MKNLCTLQDTMETVTIIIPVKDEEVGLQYLLDNYKKSNYFNNSQISFIFVIDGRTSDLSKNVAREFSDIVIDQDKTHGKGAAIRQALEVWSDNMTNYVIFMDADGSYSFEDVSKIIKSLDDGSDVVSGSRFLEKKGIPKGMGYIHNFGNRALSFIASLRNRRRISDLCTGLWGFKCDSIDKLDLKSNGFDIEAEIAGKSRRSKLSHREVPVEWAERKGGSSKLNSLRDGTIILLRILRT